ncbi:MAG: SpoIVB peptidase [Oscillospiraceae bacterium]|jgi:stage IV sporulation protein B|nr:SpoIVB peptidase [Oscillospiraceae bacterium]
MRKIFKAAYGTLSFCVLLLCVIFCFYYTKLPDKFYLSGSAPLNIRTFFKITADYDEEYALQALSSADMCRAYETANLKLFGIIPIKEVKLERIDRPVLVPCGSPFGIKIRTDGAVVTGLGDIDGNPSPARIAGIRKGDVIRAVNGISIEKSSDITEAVQLATCTTEVILIRDGRELSLDISPVKSRRDNLYRLGVWVRASSAGIGTLTFYDPERGVFGGLGHGVTDVDTGKILPLSSGEAVSVTISGIVKGRPGEPGELSGTFMSRVPIGTIEQNTELGVFGTMNYAPSLESGIPMAFKQEIKAGPATILATIGGSNPKEYDILIERIDFNENNHVKNMIIRITDIELISRTGGIVQGMSGSPIMQNGMLIGAVTHVFINDSTRGYAIFAENMFRKMSEVMVSSSESFLEAA